MNSIHDQVLSEIESARKLAAKFASRHGSIPAGSAKEPRGAARLAQEEAAATEIAALAAEEERLTSQVRARAVNRASARAEEQTQAERTQQPLTTRAPETEQEKVKVKPRGSAMAILKGLAKLRSKERSAAEDLIRKAREVRDEEPGGVTVAEPESRQEAPRATVRGMWAPSLGAAQVWFFTSGEGRCGPVTFAELRTMAASRVLDPRHDLVWKKGMSDWKQAGLLHGLFERRSVPAESTKRRRAKPPKTVAALPNYLTGALAAKDLTWPGVDRLTLWLGLLLFPLLWSQIMWWISPARVASFGSDLMSKLLPLAAYVPIPVLLYLVLTRLLNVGMSRWWALGLAIPILNLWIAFRCLICPSGYAYHRKLDRAGMAATLAVVLLVPAALFINWKYPGLLSPPNLQLGLRFLFENARNLIDSR